MDLEWRVRRFKPKHRMDFRFHGVAGRSPHSRHLVYVREVYLSKSSSANSSDMLNKQQLCQGSVRRASSDGPPPFILSRLLRQQYVIDAAVSIVIPTALG